MLHPHPTPRAALFTAFTLTAICLGSPAWAQGTNNTNNGINAGIFAGASNTISGGQRSFIGAGLGNTITGGSNSFIGAGSGNFIDGLNNLNNISVIVAGANNTNRAGRAVIVGGRFNLINTNSRGSTISGGEYNQIQAINPALGPVLAATISGGRGNIVGSNAIGGVVAGGQTNSATGPDSAVGGGFDNVASGSAATVPGGMNNEASGTNSFAAGTRAVASHDYSFVWGGSPDVDTVSSNAGTFTVRAPGGAKFLSSTDNSTGPVLQPNATDWAAVSDSNLKTGITAVNHREVLAKLADLPISSWRYKHDPDRRYIGPMAQDFHATFGLGFDDKHISTLDTDGVTLSAIKGLVEEIREQDEVLDARDRQIQALESAIEGLRERVPSTSF
jgi:hypothetical protein